MEPTERIEVRNIYVSNASIFGVLYGLCVGVIVALFVLIAGLITPAGFRIFGIVYGASIGSLLGMAFIGFFITVVVFFLGSVIGSLIYNFVARVGGKLTLGLAQYVPPKPKAMKDLGSQMKKNYEKDSMKSQGKLKAADYMSFGSVKK